MSGCSLSFTGAALDPAIKTFSVETFQNSSGQGPATLSQTLTDEFRTYVQRNSNLKFDPGTEGDVQYSGQITSYTVQPVNATAQGGVEAAGANRLTITLQVRFVNSKNPKQSFEQSFSQFSDFDRTRNANQLDDGFIREIANRLYLEIFNRSLSNW
ncbi:MAG: LptE family protein [Hymenobacteraceae bacterium]|nr:LptE family protein [Hymenobacteraceae bacterium]